MPGNFLAYFNMDRSKLENKARWLATVAHHEAGHAIAAFEFGGETKSLSIVPNDESTGIYSHNPYFSDEDVENILYGEMTAEQQVKIENNALICLAGPWAQKRYNPKGFRKHHGESDRKVAMSFLGRVREGESLSLYYKLIDLDARNFIQNDRFWGAICNLANSLLNQPEMFGKEVHLAILESFKKYNDNARNSIPTFLRG